MRRAGLQLAVFAIHLIIAPVAAMVADEEGEFFERNVRPVLVDRCFSCHGPQKQESGLRLDSRDAILRGGDRGPSVELANPERSLLIAAIRHVGDLQMPPEGKIPIAEVAAISRWVKQGLRWPSSAPSTTRPQVAPTSHWAFGRLRRPKQPLVADDSWARTPIDRFILARLEKHQLGPMPLVDRGTFIRRATFDLTGLPPSPAAIAAFLSDDRPAARARLIDRLLGSPQYGPRWGRHWLDVARYADNKGYVFFEQHKYPWAYTYRDYIIRAFNEDLSYDRFVLEQLAADQLDLGDDRRPLAALGFLTVGGHFMNNTHDIIDDRIDVVTRGLMGLTVTCARCHDHKFDPIPQTDYYALYGVFRSCYEPILPPLFELPPASEEYEKFAAEMSKRERALVDFVTEKHRSLVTDARTRIAAYLLAAYARRGQPPADDFMLLVEQGDLNPSMILRWQVYLDNPRVDADLWSPWRALVDLSPADFPRRSAERLDQFFATPESESLNPLVRAALLDSPLTSMRDVATRYERVLNVADAQWRAALAAAKEAARAPPQSLPNPVAERLRQVLYGPTAPPQAPLVMDWGFLSLFPDRPTQAEYKKLLKAVEQWSATGPGAPARAMVLFDSPVAHQPRVFRRGNPNRLGEAVPRRFLSAVPPHQQPLTQGSGRLQLAEAIVQRTNPLTARVLVNRVWMYHFGRGLVETPSDFGLRSDPPSHPELLDYLASEFIDSGWSIKRLHRLIMTSAVYQQASSSARETARERDSQRIDPRNRLLWKMNRRRLEFEALRDALLDVAGRLETTMYGEPGDQHATDGKDFRRSIYGFVDRMNVSSLLTTFDFPNPATSSPRRLATTVPTQALYFMNNAFTRSIAKQAMQRPDLVGLRNPRARLQRIYLLFFGRPPTEQELELAEAFVGDEPALRDWTVFAHALLMTNEFAFVD